MKTKAKPIVKKKVVVKKAVVVAEPPIEKKSASKKLKKLIHEKDSADFKGMAIVIDEQGTTHVAATSHDYSALCGQAINSPGKVSKKYCQNCRKITKGKK